ncbi:BnaA06g24880D [Brassica napus]|uniref:BnaA06g24880D protein n=2 Tax=Brassica napus TaxID=3708 RepID=A0A078F5P2_BRANA|nr:BnaA06g24880D [Brassica napus]
MRRREEKRRKLHEALLETLYPPSSPPSPSSSPSSVGFGDEPFDVTLINPEDYVKIDSSNHEENGDESETKPSRAQRKRIRKKMLKEEAARRRKVIGPLLPTEMIETREDSDGGEEASCVQPARLNASEKEEKVRFEGNDKTKRVKKRREAKKLAKESSRIQPQKLLD